MSVDKFGTLLGADRPVPGAGFELYGLTTGEVRAAVAGFGYFSLGSALSFGDEFNEDGFDGFVTTDVTEPNLATAQDLVVNVPAGNYIGFWTYGWNHDAANNDFIAEIVLDPGGSETVLMRHQQEPKDVGGGGPGGTDQLQRVMDFNPNLALSGAHTIRLRFGSSAAGVDSTVFNPRLCIWRVS